MLSHLSMAELFNIAKGKIGILSATPGDYTLVTTGENHSTHIEPHFSGDAVCIPLISATGHGHASLKRLHHVKGDFAVGSILCACVNKRPDIVLARYVYYYLTACKESVLIPLMQGTANMSMKVKDINKIKLPLPSLSRQESIVSALDELQDKVRKVEEHLCVVESNAENLLALYFSSIIKGVPLRLIEEVAPLIRREQIIELDGMYPELGVRSFGKGTFHKPTLMGTDVGSKRLFKIEPGDLIFSNVFAWEGAIAVAQLEDAGRFGSHRFITCKVDRNILIPDFLRYYFLTDEGLLKINEASPGGAGRNRTLGLKKLMAIKVPVPSIEVQNTFKQLLADVNMLKEKHSAIRQANSALIPAMLERIFI